MHYDYFVSGRWRNKHEVMKLARGIRNKGCTAYCFLDAIHNQDNQDVDPYSHIEAFEKLDWRTDPYVRDAFEEDMTAQKNSDTFVLLLPAGKSCHMEAGVSFGLGKKCVLIGEQKEAESLYLIFDEVFSTPEQFLASL